MGSNKFLHVFSSKRWSVSELGSFINLTGG